MKNFLIYLTLFCVLFVLGLFVLEVEKIFWEFITSLALIQRDKYPALLMATVFSILYIIPLIQNYFIKKELKKEGKDFARQAAKKINTYFLVAFIFGFLSFAVGSFYMLKSNQSLGGILLACSVIIFIVYTFLSGTKIPAYFKYKKAFDR